MQPGELLRQRNGHGGEIDMDQPGMCRIEHTLVDHNGACRCIIRKHGQQEIRLGQLGWVRGCYGSLGDQFLDRSGRARALVNVPFGA